MDKETIIALTLGEPDKKGLVYEYCIEMGKEELETSKFLAVLILSPYYHWCFNYALDYYQRKFNVCIIRNKDGRIITAY